MEMLIRQADSPTTMPIWKIWERAQNYSTESKPQLQLLKAWLKLAIMMKDLPIEDQMMVSSLYHTLGPRQKLELCSWIGCHGIAVTMPLIIWQPVCSPSSWVPPYSDDDK